MASNVEQQQPWDDGVDICGQSVPTDNDEGWRRAVASMKPKDEPMDVMNEDDDGGLYERLMRDDARINAQLSDLRAAHRAGALDREAFSAQALERLTGGMLGGREPPRSVPPKSCSGGAFFKISYDNTK